MKSISQDIQSVTIHHILIYTVYHIFLYTVYTCNVMYI